MMEGRDETRYVDVAPRLPASRHGTPLGPSFQSMRTNHHFSEDFRNDARKLTELRSLREYDLCEMTE